MEQFTLGEVCTIIKGSTGIKKAIAGDYPLVVTAEERLSSNEYQFDTKAVCIPLVSSTGHGHASLKRIHYQEGKFALGNILAAVIPNDEKQLNAEFLYYYLSFYKDSKIVPLMKGAANVSLTINSIKTIIIEIPDIKVQEKIIETIKNAKCKSNLINNKCFEQELLIESLKKSILFDAVQGKLVPQDPSDEPVSALLKRIQAEKEQLFKDGKIKKEKLLNPIFEDEIPFEIPQGWEWVKLNEIAFVTKLAGFEYTKFIAENFVSKGIPLFKGKNVQNGNLIYDFENYIPENLSDELYRSQLNKKCLLTPYVGTIGNIAIFDGRYKCHLGSNVGKIELFNNFQKNILEEYVLYYLRSSIGLSELKKHKKATAQESISIEAIRDVIIAIPPLAEQQRIVNKVNKLMEFIEILEKKNNLVKEKTSNLLKSIEAKSLTVYSDKNYNISDIKEKRAILSAEIISQLHNEQYFGAIKLEKILYLCETHLKINLGGNYKREAAGPHDAQSRYEVENILKNKKWFDVHKEQKGNIEVTKYTPLEKCNEILKMFNKVFSAEVTNINSLLELFRGKNSDFCESVATLYAVWLNRLNKNLSCADTDLIAEFKDWSEKKSRFYDSDLQDRILFMRRKNLIPDSNIK